MRPSTRVLVFNNYPLDEVWEEVRCGTKPDHHLFGINHFASHGYDIKIVPFEQAMTLRRLEQALVRTRFPIPCGSLDRQWSGWPLLREADLIYAPCGNEVTLLAYLRFLGLLHVPIVSLQHHPLSGGKMAWLRNPWIRMQIGGIDALPALSRRVAEDVNERGTPRSQRSQPIAWGPDDKFYPRGDGVGAGVVAAGRTGRDFLTFGKAASFTKQPAKIICMGYDIKPEFAKFTSNLQIITPRVGGIFTYPEMMGHLKGAQVLAIPLFDYPQSLAGLTSLLDAMALGKPVIMTRHPLVDLDVEALGIGRHVSPGDTDEWVSAIEWFGGHPEEGVEMGRRARGLVDESGYNSRGFACKMAEIFNTVLSGNGSVHNGDLTH